MLKFSFLSKKRAVASSRVSASAFGNPRGAALEQLEGRLLMSASALHKSVPALAVHRAAVHASPTLPKATLVSARGIDDGGEVTLTLRVKYTDKRGIDLTSLGADDLSVNDGLVISSATPIDAKRRSATVSYVATGLDDPSSAIKGKATYSVSVNANSVFNSSQLAATEHTLGTVQLKLDPAASVPVPPATAPAAQTISAPYLTTLGTSSVDIQIQYTDSQGIDLSSIVPANLIIDSGSALTPSAVTTSVTDGGKTVLATYTVNAPNGTFNVNDDGSYFLNLNSAAPVTNIAGLSVPADSASLGLMHIIVPAPTPTATVGPAVSVTTFGVHTVDVTVTYHDDIAIDAGSISTSNLGFASPGSLTVVGASETSSDGGKTVVATYTLGASSGSSFKSADNGIYQVILNPTSVFNSNGQSVAGTSTGWETVTINVPDASTATPPTASVVSAPYLTDSGVSQVQIKIQYQDALGIDTSSIVAGNVVVQSATLVVNSVTFVASADGKTVVATYVIDAPSAQGFTAADDGSDNFTLSAQAPVLNIAGLSTGPDALGFQLLHIAVSA